MTNVPDRLNALLTDRYTIEREVGAGGMATVYLARDLRHHRRVALKVLRPELAAVLGTERFLSEIQVTANLQHPHLLALFDSGEAEGILFYVMPFVEGESLRDRLQRERQLPVDEAVRIAIAVAGALDYAHRHGVIHRDLKPENILLHEGQPMVADFGIALAVSKAGGSRVTQTGLSLGTPHYMSPEQATADHVIDGRSDIYSLAAVLFEMLIGEPPFTGSTAQAIAARILTEKPRSAHAARPSVPADLDAAIAVGLEKLPADRWATAKEFAEALTGRGTPLRRAEASDVKDGASAQAHSRFWPTTAAVLAVVASGAVAGLAWNAGRPLRDRGSLRVPLATAPAVVLDQDFRSPGLAISPDGQQLVYSGLSDGQRLYLQRLDSSGTVSPIPGTEGARAPFFSPDGRSIGFVIGTSLQTLALGGARSVELADVPSLYGGSWSADGRTVYFTPNTQAGIWRVSALGGEPAAPVTTPDRDGFDMGHWWPQALPGGKRLVYTSCCGHNRIMVVDLETGARTVLVEGGFFGRFVGGYLVFAQGRSLMAARFDPETLEIGSPAKVLENALTGAEQFAQFAASESGTLAYYQGVSDLGRTLMRVDRSSGASRTLGRGPRAYSNLLSLDPTSSRMAVTFWEDQQDVFIYDLARDDFDRVTTDPHNDFHAIWTPDGRDLVFNSNRGGQIDLYLGPADKSRPEQVLYASANPKWPGSWSGDGNLLAYWENHPKTGPDVWVYSTASRDARPFRNSPASELWPSLSPDGRWIAFQSDELGDYEVYVAPYPGPGPTCKVSAAGGTRPKWTREGRELLFRQGTSIMGVDVGDGRFCNARAEQVFDGVDPMWEVSAGGDFFMTLEPRDPPTMHLVLNWLDELERSVPAGP
jgi:eukaryotic-like serine/threonine-protein kinase